MIRRSRSPHRIAFTAACLALAGVRLGAEHAAKPANLADKPAAEKPAPAEKSAVTPAPAEPAKVVEQPAKPADVAGKPGEQAEKSAESAAQPAEKPAKPKRAADEFEGLLNLGAQLTERGDFE